MSDEPFLSRWSRLKRRPEAGPERPTADVVPAQAGTPLQAAIPQPAEPAPVEKPLPPVESLTPESDFTPFMKAEVEPGIRRQALKTLFQDPRFNVMDGLDVYIDDYSKPDPLPEGWLEKMNQVARLGEYRDPEEKAPKPDREGEPGELQGEPAAEEISQQNEALAAEAAPLERDPATPLVDCKESTLPPQVTRKLL